MKSRHIKQSCPGMFRPAILKAQVESFGVFQHHGNKTQYKVQYESRGWFGCDRSVSLGRDDGRLVAGKNFKTTQAAR